MSAIRRPPMLERVVVDRDAQRVRKLIAALVVALVWYALTRF